jgi:hypothetical protein
MAVRIMFLLVTGSQAQMHKETRRRIEPPAGTLNFEVFRLLSGSRGDVHGAAVEVERDVEDLEVEESTNGGSSRSTASKAIATSPTANSRPATR